MIRLSADPTDEELARDWTLSAEDLVEVRRCRGAERRHSFALQLCTLRLFGRFLGDDYGVVPIRIMNHVGQQLGLPPVLFVSPPSREATDLEHERRIREHLRFTPFDEHARTILERWLNAQAARGLLAEELAARAEEFLRTQRIVLPARGAIERMVATVAARTEGKLHESVYERLSPELRRAIDEILEPKADGRSKLFELKRYPEEPKPKEIRVYLGHATLLRTTGAARIDFSGIRPELVIHFAELARRYNARELRRFAPAKRCALVASFLAETSKTVLDHLVEMHHVFMTSLHRNALNAYEDRQRELRQRSARNLRTVLDALEALLDESRPREEVTQTLDVAAVRDAIDGCRELQHTTEHGQLDALRKRHQGLKTYLPQFLQLPFEAEAGSEPLLAAIDFARALHAGELSIDDAPIDFATGMWRKALTRGRDLRTWDLALAFTVRDALRSGDLYLAESRHHVSFWNLVQGPEQWAAARARAYLEMKLPTVPDQAIDRLRAEFNESLGAFTRGLDENPFARVRDGALKLKRRDALDIPESVDDLRRALEPHLPRIRIEDLLVEVDRRCGFTRELVPPAGYSPRLTNRYATILAALVAHDTNLGTARMEPSSNGIATTDMLQRATRWFLRQLPP